MKEKFVITVGRQFGSGGREIGLLISQMLGISFYDRKLLSEAARRSGLSDEVLEKSDERTPGSLMHALTVSFGFGGFSAESIFKIQSDAILDVVSNESCVIVGRCADYVLRDNPRCYNTFIHCPLEERMARVAIRKDIEVEQARELILKTDKSRAAYYDFYTGKKWGDSKSYHLSVDSAVLGMEKTAEYICGFVKEALERG